MARSSGKVTVNPRPQSFRDSQNGAAYALDRRFRLRYSRGEVQGEIELQWFIGSGNVGSSYVHERSGFLFEAPASYYAKAGKWDLSPGYHGKQEIDLARPIEKSCLYCHASNARMEGLAVSCERCHGPGERHAAGDVKSIVNPAKLPPRQRDSICEQCHLTGVARVERRGKAMHEFRAGDDWGDFVATFLGSREKAAATDHAEQLSMSRCKQLAGDKLWCGSCHDPHDAKPVGSEACRSCHAKAHAGERGDCVKCHMPKAATQEGDHVAYTNHSIPRDGKPRVDSRWRLYPGTNATARDEALALGNRLGLARAAEMDDAPVLAALAQIEDRLGNMDAATALYERLAKADPNHPALANLAIYRVGQGRSQEAIALWERVLANDPVQAAAAMNLSLHYAQKGQKADAERTLERLLRFQPDLTAARKFLRSLRGGL